MTKDIIRKKRLFNDTFNIAKPTWLNACAGENGAQDIETYAEAYRLAPQILLDKVIEQGKLTELTDTLVFPIVFCIRHAVELQIKDSILKLNNIRSNRQIEQYKVSGSHDIGIIWSFFIEQSLITDSRYQSLIDDITPYINDIAEIDPTGQVFRYPNDNEDNKHLVNTPIVNLALLKKRFTELDENLKKLNRLSNRLIEEYGQGTYTDTLSRYDISNIAELLLNREEWSSEDFVEVKENIKNTFSLSNRKLSKVADLIQEHYEFCQKINIEKPLKHALYEDFLLYVKCLKKIHPIKEDAGGSGIDFWERDAAYFEEMKERDEIIINCVNTCLDKISAEALADIAALYELGRHPGLYWSEPYERILGYELKDHVSASKKKDDIFNLVRHRLQKTNAYDSIILSLTRLGQNSIINRIND